MTTQASYTPDYDLNPIAADTAHGSCCDCTPGYLGEHCEMHFEAERDGEGFDCDEPAAPLRPCFCESCDPDTYAYPASDCHA